MNGPGEGTGGGGEGVGWDEEWVGRRWGGGEGWVGK